MAAELGRRAGHLYPVDMEDTEPEAVEAESRLHHAKILEQPLSAPEFVSVPGREKVQLEASSMRFLPLYREESRCALLVLIDPQDKNTVLAIYLHRSWWPIEDMVKTADPSREGLMQVRTFAERVVLFVLNCIIFGRLERGSTCDVLFTPHSEKECAKVFWRGGQAAAFYTIKAKGSLCAGSSSQCYRLPVLDTLFVRRRFRRRGLGLRMLQDFCQAFAAEGALGISCPLSAGMYQVCRRFLETRPEEQARLWEVESPGDWSQRENIWLKMQLTGSLPRGDIQGVRQQHGWRPGLLMQVQLQKRFPPVLAAVKNTHAWQISGSVLSDQATLKVSDLQETGGIPLAGIPALCFDRLTCS
ncbi:hypothetical protein lerEdw1_011141 [Lerista edwardsae]|nr:hypothetical protein lerEdw1_011141 [Lerista edwardsae]